MMSLIGKVQGEKGANYTGIKNFVTSAWSYPKGLKVSELGFNIFQFYIPDEEDRVRILNRGPWILDI